MKLIRPVEITDAVLSSSNVTEADYAAWSAATTYAAGDHVISTTSHKIYESAQASNINHNPVTDDGTWWTEISATNRWKMFDDAVQSQTTNSDSIAVAFAVTGRADTVGLQNISGSTARITVTDDVDGVVYDETFSLISTAGITDWYDYFFEPVERVTDFSVTDLPPYADPTIDVTITETGASVKCGELVIGLSKDLGVTGMGASVGIKDYSVKQADDLGSFTIVERAFAKTANFTVLVDAAKVDAVQRTLATYRATPVLYVGDEGYGATAVFGFYRDFSIEISYPDYSICTLQVEGLS